MSICSKVIFRMFLVIRTTECTFEFDNRFLKQLRGCTIGERLSVTFSDIYMVNMKNDFVILSKPIFYQRFVHDIYSGRKIGNNVLFDCLKNYYSNNKLTIELSPSMFLDTKLTNINGFYKFHVSRKSTKLPSP